MPYVHIAETSNTGDWAAIVYAEPQNNTYTCEVDKKTADYLLAGKPDDPTKFATMFHCLESLKITGFPARLTRPLMGQKIGQAVTRGPDYRSVPGGTLGTPEKWAEVPAHFRTRSKSAGA